MKQRKKQGENKIKNYKIMLRDSNFPVTTDVFSSLKDVQKELNWTKNEIKKGNTLFNSVEQFMNTEFIVFNENNCNEIINFMGNKRI